METFYIEGNRDEDRDLLRILSEAGVPIRISTTRIGYEVTCETVIWMRANERLALERSRVDGGIGGATVSGTVAPSSYYNAIQPIMNAELMDWTYEGLEPKHKCIAQNCDSDQNSFYEDCYRYYKKHYPSVVVETHCNNLPCIVEQYKISIT